MGHGRSQGSPIADSQDSIAIKIERELLLYKSMPPRTRRRDQIGATSTSSVLRTAVY